MLFKFLADIEFEADSIDDAFYLLAHHFDYLERGEEPWFEYIGTMNIEPVKQQALRRD